MNKGQGVKIVNPTMKILEQYVYIHFDTEEALMREALYPDIDKHILQHPKFIERAKLLFREAQKNDNAAEILRFLKEWWLNHIQHEDKKYYPFIDNPQQ
jgi:hemerythrin